ncbi:MAG: glycosyl hydrolase 115 family protein [Oscillospiraceae bacterium]|nr:glycosyl hydrolase 115 family protein [Oscillospiraceae bacterium]
MSKFVFTVESEAFEGVKRIAQKIVVDFEMVTGEFPKINETLQSDGFNIIFATLGKSSLLSQLGYDPCEIAGKREVYQIKLIDDKTLLVCGSDKRGTIYGMFALSEFIGVSPLYFWGDVKPIKNKNLKITGRIEVVSKEPSVKYRGFFINDEWPCFGSWTFGQFGGFTAEMYDHVFELLLRLKGNYLWPAMWSSSFPLDGPGNLSEELADIYGVVMGTSHHEPCLRASEEWDKVKGEDSEYGSEWNYYINKDGLIRYWEDGLKRSGKYENLITIGMRGERDTPMLGLNSSVKDNIDLLKDIIKNQRELIKKHVNPDLDQVPQMLALYKEVESYFYGDDEVDGLKDWDELDGVTCMLCEDNYGFMRTLPEEAVRERKGGWGMYYHFDYHGGPISYEWMPSTTFEKTWEQMCMAYDYGINEIWVVNVGDLKFNEVPLAYFLELAYDFEKWGTNAPLKSGSVGEYTKQWLKKTFPSVNPETRDGMGEVLHKYLRMNSLRRPEAINADIYHPCHYLEADLMMRYAKNLEQLNESVYLSVPEEVKDAYYSMIYFPAKISANLINMHLFAAKSLHYAKQGKKIGNTYSEYVAECIKKDRELCEEFAEFNYGKWRGMQLGQHIGFVKWNEDNSRFPLRVLVEPAYKPRMVVSRKDKVWLHSKTYGIPEVIEVPEFLTPGSGFIIIEIANDGIGSIDYVIEGIENYDWLRINSIKGVVHFQEEIVLYFDESKITNDVHDAQLLIKGGETVVAIKIKARNMDTDDLPSMTFIGNENLIIMESNHFYDNVEAAMPSGGEARFEELVNHGRSGAGMKVFPTTAYFSEADEKPTLKYRFLIEEAGNYTAEIWTTPTNSVRFKKPLRFMFNSEVVTAVTEDFNAGHYSDMRWCQGVLDNIRKNKTSLKLEKGVQEISISALDAGLVLERILIYKEDTPPALSYLGPPESFYTV